MEAALPRDLKEYKVFIASPGNLQPGRTEFRDVIEEYNKHEARPRGAEFVAVGWEDTLPAARRPQTIINAEIQTCPSPARSTSALPQKWPILWGGTTTG